MYEFVGDVKAVQFKDAKSIALMRKEFTPEEFNKNAGFIDPQKQVTMNTPCGTQVALVGDWVVKAGGYFMLFKPDQFKILFRKKDYGQTKRSESS